jgi:muconate cycloisomerase
LVDGTTGWGEGVPRSYVTGETPAGCLEQLANTQLDEQLAADCNAWPEVVRMCEELEPYEERDDPRGCYGNALQCAVELSILDAYGQLFNEPVSVVAKHVLEASQILTERATVQYSAVIDAGATGLWRKALVRRWYGFRHCKVKVGAQSDNDAERLGTIRRWIGSRMDLRVDANEAWHAEEVLANVAQLRPFHISCVEQPVPHAEVAALAELRTQIGMSIMLDESLTSAADAEAAIADKTCDLFNIRLSKCGGFVASLKLAAMAHAAGLGYQLGCHPGETGVLSAAGRHWACAVGNIRYAEGSYDRHVFNRPLTNEDMTFGYGGRAPAIRRAGLGVTMNEASLKELTVTRQELNVS